MLDELQFTDARKDFTSMYNKVFNSYKPMIIKRKQAEEVLLLRTDLQKMLLSNFSLKPEVLNEEDGSVTLALDILEMYVNAETLDKAIIDLVQDLKDYAQDYIGRSQLFLNAPNRRPHFPYVLRILLCENDEEIRSLLET
ncbi:exoribonuclease R [Phosphitispora fastidiosa]|uniref:exoribonuclease R n=1 Tax=Phosphitispora fastidiosa TaxID=2837202 RepID=UPI001E5C9FF2|nr:exoribonuclease R [Phosphitispora fastidiosa]MBU7005105.1 regulator of RNase E activity RraB [Phosphitispora fastidiosa]